MNIENLRVVIVGGATAGAGAALLFARAGARVTLVERVQNPSAVGAGIALAENGLAVLESIGLGPALSREGTPIGSPRIVDGQGRVLMQVPGPVPRALMVRRNALQQLLLDAVAAEPRIDAIFGAQVVDGDRDGTVELCDGSGRRQLRGDLVIGADGVHSRVRELGDHGARLRASGVHYVRALVEAEVARNEEAWTRAGLFGSFAVPGGSYLYASVGGRQAKSALARHDLPGFRAAWARAYAPAGELLGAVRHWDQLLVNAVMHVECRRWFDGRLVLAGDAAHAMAPNLGQGANSALVDVAVLLDELRRASALEAALQSYQARRKPAVTKVARTAARLGALAELTHPVARFVRDRLLMPLVSRFANTDTTAAVLQEPTETLLAIGRA